MNSQNYREAAMRHALGRIDREPGQHTSKQQRTRVLRELIQQHNLQELFGRAKTLQNLTLDRYTRMVQEYAREGGASMGRLFEQGSSALRRDFLGQIGYDRSRERASGVVRQSAFAGVPDTTTSEGASDVNDAEIAPTQAHPKSPAHRKSFAKASEKIRSAADFSDENPDLSDNERRGKKRKFEASEEPHPDARAKSPRLETSHLANNTSSVSLPLSSPDAVEDPHRSQGPQRRKKRSIDQVDEEDEQVQRRSKSVRLAQNNKKTASKFKGSSGQAPIGSLPGDGKMVRKPGLIYDEDLDDSADELANGPAGPSRRQYQSGLGKEHRREAMRAQVQNLVLGPTFTAKHDQRRLYRVGEERTRDTGEPDENSVWKPAHPPSIGQFAEGSAYNSRTPGLNISRLKNVPDGTIKDNLNRAFEDHDSNALVMMDHAGPSADNDAGHAKVVLDPSPELEPLYALTFGLDWKERVRRLKQVGLIRQHHITTACSTAALFKMIWERPLPWAGAKESVAKIEADEHWLNAAMAFYTRNVEIKTIIWHGAYHRAQSRDFQEETIEPIASDLMEKFWSIVEPQLAVGGSPATNEDPYKDPVKDQEHDKFFEGVVYRYKRGFTKVLITKGLMEASPDYYTVEWIASGAKYDVDLMHEVHGDPVSEEERVVLWCVSPLIKARRQPDEEDRVAARAYVYTAPRKRFPWA